MGMSRALVVIASALAIVGLLFFVIVMSFNGWRFDLVFSEGIDERIVDLDGGIQNITVNVSATDVTVLPSTDGAGRVVIREHRNIHHKAAQSGGELTIGYEDERSWIDHLFNFIDMSITVYLPAGEYAELKIDASTADIEIREGFVFSNIAIKVGTGDVLVRSSALGAVTLEASTGDVQARNIECASLSATTGTGDISVSGVSAAGDASLNAASGTVALTASTGDVRARNTACASLSVTTSTGDIEIEGASVAGAISTSVSTGKTELSDVACAEYVARGGSGDIELERVVASGKLDIQVRTGDVELEDSDAADIYITTTTGDVEGSLLSEKVFITSTSTGEVDVPNTVAGGRCEITTSTGDIEISVKGK